jgi:hypothetical protein
MSAKELSETNTAPIKVEHAPEQAEFDGFDAYPVSLVNPFGEHPSGLWETVEETVKESVDFSRVPERGSVRVGTVTYDADEIRDITIN